MKSAKPPLVVYTAITDGYDRLAPVPENWRGHARFVAFLEKKQAADGWEVRPIYRRFRDPCRNAKIHKILPHVYFPDAECSLWVDGSVRIISKMPPEKLFAQALRRHDLAVFRHRERDCIYQEGVACIRLGKDDPAVIHRQMRRYFAEGYPANHGLAECTIIFRRHTPAVEKFCDAWYEEIKNGSRRDQLSFNYVAARRHFKYGTLPGTTLRNPHFLWGSHTARGK